METRTLGGSELAASLVGLGCNNFGMKLDADGTQQVVHACLDAGITFFDTADMYGGGKSEEFLGKALGARRKDVVLATKFGGMDKMQGKQRYGAPDAVVACVDASLSRLGTDWIDLYQMHYPDPDVPIEETLGALDALITSGKVRAVGHSNFDAAQIAGAAAAASDNAFVSAQNEWSLLARNVEADVVPACEAASLSMIPYFPLASGMLTGKYRRGEDFDEGTRLGAMSYFADVASDENFDKVEALERVAQDGGRSLLELAFGWLAAQPSVASVIAGATTPEQVRANAGAVARPLEAGEVGAIEAALDPA